MVSPVQERVCSRSKRTTPPSIIRLWGEQCRFYPKQKGAFSIKQGQIGSVEAQRCLLSTGEDCKGRLGLIKARGNYTVLHSHCQSEHTFNQCHDLLLSQQHSGSKHPVLAVCGVKRLSEQIFSRWCDILCIRRRHRSLFLYSLLPKKKALKMERCNYAFVSNNNKPLLQSAPSQHRRNV